MKKWNINRALASVLAALMVMGGTASLQTLTAPLAQAATSATEETELTNDSTLSKDTIDKGQSVTVKCAAAGGKGSYQYAVFYKRASSTSWTTAQEYSTNRTVTITPTAAVDYDICVRAKDAAGKVAKKTLTLKVLAALQNNSKLSKSTIFKGESVTIKGAAKGGAGGYQYAFYYKRTSRTSYYCAQEFSETSSVSITPSVAMDHDVLVKIKDANGTTVSKTLVLHVLPPIENNSSISKDTVFLGETVTLNGSATGGSEGFTYAYYYKRASKTKWTVGKGYSSSTSVTIKPGASVDYDVRINVKDSMGHVNKKDFVFHVLSPLKNKSTLSAKAIFKGESFTVTGAASGGAGGYQYACYYKRTDVTGWTTASGYSDATTVIITPKYGVNYDVRIKVKDAMGNVAVKNAVVAVMLPFENKSSISSTTFLKGESLTMTGAATGGSGGYKFAFYYKKVSSTRWTTLQSYGTNDTVTITPKTATEYEVCLKVKDSMGHVVKKNLTFKVLPALENKATLSADVVKKGQSVTVNLSGKGGSGDLVYAVYYRRASSTGWTTAQDYADTKAVSFTPKYAETYTVRVKVKDSMGHITAKDLPLIVFAALKNNSAISAETAHLGEAVLLSGAASGGSETYEYAYYYRNASDNDWILLQDFSDRTVCEASFDEPGLYELMVTVRDGFKNSDDKTFSLVVDDELFNLSKISANAINKGESVTVTAAASGGSGSYTYACYYKETAKETWTTAQKYGTGTTITVTPRYASEYEIRVDVKDSLGNVSQKFFLVQVTAKLKNNSTINGTAFVEGESAVITAAAEGGTGDYTYAFYMTAPNAPAKVTLRDFATEPTVTIDLDAAGTYTFIVAVRDSGGREAEKSFTAAVSERLENLSSIDTDRIAAGQSVTVWGDASGGRGDYAFAFSTRAHDEEEWTLVRDYSADESISIPFETAGTYDILVSATDETKYRADTVFTVEVIPALTNTSSIDKTQIVKGDSVTVTGSAQGGSGDYTYAYAFKQIRSTSWTTLKDFSTDTTASLTLNSAVVYSIRVTVRDSMGSESEKLFFVSVASVLTNTSTVSAESILMGESVTMTASATGGLGDYSYAYAYKLSSDKQWTPLDEEGSEAVFKPSATGTYDLRVTVTDSTDTQKSKTFTLVVDPAFVNNSTVSTTETTVGGRAVLTGVADGQSTGYTYAFLSRTPVSSRWTTLQGYSTVNTYTVNFTSAGSYELCVSIRDQLGNVEDKSFFVNVLQNVTNLSTVSATEFTLGEGVTVHAAASGGTGTYTYSYFYKESSANTWTLLLADSDEQTLLFTPSAAGDYDLRVVAKDSSGNADYMDFAVTAVEGFENTSTVDHQYLVTGGVLTMSASAKGGTAPYTYAYYYSWDDGQNWNTAYDYSTVTVLRMTLSSAADYLIRIDVKDAAGNVASKSFQVVVRDENISNESYLDAFEVKQGTNVVLHNDYEGGVGTVTFSTYYRREGSTSWTTVSTNSTASVISFKISALGNYEVRSVVKDAQSNSSERLFTVEIVDELFEVKLDNILSQIINPNMDELQKLKAIHDWMINYAEYDTAGYNSGNISDSSHTAKGFINNKKAVCDGYTETFLLLTQKAGFSCEMVSGVANNGSGTESHAWNQVKMGGKWYNVDVTWDDPVVDGSSNGDNLSYKYFLIPDSVLNTNHYTQNSPHSCTTAQPTDRLISMVLDEELQSHSDYAYCTSEAELKSAMQSFYNNGVKTFTLIYRTTVTDRGAILNTVAAQRPAYTGMSGSVMDWKFSGYYQVTVTLT